MRIMFNDIDNNIDNSDNPNDDNILRSIDLIKPMKYREQHKLFH